MSEFVINSYKKGSLYKIVTNGWDDCHDAALGSEVYWAATQAVPIKTYYIFSHIIDRGIASFNTASLPDDLSIISAYLNVYPVTNIYQDGHFDVHVIQGDFEDTPVLADYGNLLDDTISRGSINTADIVLNDWNKINLNATGISEINKTGYTKFAFRSSYDINDIEPGDGKYNVVLFKGSEYIELHVIGLWSPTVVTNPATTILPNEATINGTLSDDGGEPCDCGFQWGETISYGHTTDTQSRETGQTFLRVITELKSNTVYHFRAFATNSIATVYGADEVFKTLRDDYFQEGPPYDLSALEAIRNVEMSAMGRYYVDELGKARYESRYARNK